MFCLICLFCIESIISVNLAWGICTSRCPAPLLWCINIYLHLSLSTIICGYIMYYEYTICGYIMYYEYTICGYIMYYEYTICGYIMYYEYTICGYIMYYEYTICGCIMYYDNTIFEICNLYFSNYQHNLIQHIAIYYFFGICWPTHQIANYWYMIHQIAHYWYMIHHRYR